MLAALGGFDIAGLCGVFLGGALERLPIVMDGFISGVAALCAVRLCPAAEKAVFASHVSSEPAAHIVLGALCKNRLSPQSCIRRGHGRGGQPAAVGYGAGRLQRLLLVCGGRHHAVHPAVLTLVIGGAASGKSAYAESLCLRAPLPRTYLATMQVWDAECAARVAKHRAMRAEKQFTTVECPLHLDRVALPRRGTVLLEDLGNGRQ